MIRISSTRSIPEEVKRPDDRQAPAVNIAERGWSVILKSRQRSGSMDKRAKSSKAVLTPAEKRVLSLVSASMTNREIASSLGVSPATVKRHMENIMHKLQLRNRVDAAIFGLSMAGHCAANNGDCPLVAWRKWHDNRKMGRLADRFPFRLDDISHL